MVATVDSESLRRRVKALILSYFTKDTECDLCRGYSGRYRSAQIIYSYLQSAACRYLVLQDSWLEDVGEPDMEAALRDF